MHQVRENVQAQIAIGFAIASHWFRKWCEFVNKSQNEVKWIQSKQELL